MKTNKLNPDAQKLKTIELLSKISHGPTIALFKKTFIFDVCTINKIIMAIFFMVLVPGMIFVFIPQSSLFEGLSVIQAGGLGFVTWYYNFSIIFPIIIIASTGPLISEEMKSKTMLYLVSKPITRTKIILAKFAAAFLFGMIVSFSSLSIICIIALFRYSFTDISAFLGMNFIYSIIIIFFFGGMSIGLSSIFKKPGNVPLIPIMIIILSFFIFMSFRPMLMGYGFGVNLYEKFTLYNFDIGYHFANIFMWISESFVPQIRNYLGMLFFMFGIVKMEYTGEGFEYSSTYYYHPIASCIYLIVIAGIILIVGIIILNKRDISG
ncbi:MAG: ABC transporter permease [Promethearchaeota archaeon]